MALFLTSHGHAWADLSQESGVPQLLQAARAGCTRAQQEPPTGSALAGRTLELAPPKDKAGDRQ